MNWSQNQDVELSTLSGLDQISFSGVTMEDSENNVQGVVGVGALREVRGAGGKKRRRTFFFFLKRRSSTYDNVTQSFPAAEFHNETFDFASAAVYGGGERP
ncbi:hypothetical protein ACOMHN_022085 [Nucella lapillus]